MYGLNLHLDTELLFVNFEISWVGSDAGFGWAPDFESKAVLSQTSGIHVRVNANTFSDEHGSIASLLS